MTPLAGGVLSLKHTVESRSTKKPLQRCLNSAFFLIETLQSHKNQRHINISSDILSVLI